MKGNKKLAFIRSSYRPDGGAEKILQQMITVLQEECSYNLYMLTRKWQPSDNPEGSKDTLKIINCKSGGISRRSRFTGFVRTIQQIISKENFDIIQSHERIPGCQIYRAGDGVHQQWINIRLERTNYFQGFMLKYSLFHRKVIQAEKELFYHKKLRYVICNSNQIKHEIIKHYPKINPTKLILIRNGINLVQFSYADQAMKVKARDTLNLSTDQLTIAFVGSGFYRKGLKLLLNALQRRKKWKLIIIGHDKKNSHYKKLCKKIGIADRVTFYGKQSDVIPYYQAADLVVHPALYDPAPNIVLEAMAIGRAVICSQNCGTSELISSGKNGFICNHKDISKLAMLLEKCENITLLRKMGESARLTAELYPATDMVQKMVRLYKHIDSKPSHSGLSS